MNKHFPMVLVSPDNNHYLLQEWLKFPTLPLDPQPPPPAILCFANFLSPATMGFCQYCQENYDSYESTHLRTCHAYCFQVHEHPHSKTGKLITVEQNGAICRCVFSSENVCNKTFVNLKGWQKHYAKDHCTDSWLVSDNI